LIAATIETARHRAANKTTTDHTDGTDKNPRIHANSAFAGNLSVLSVLTIKLRSPRKFGPVESIERLGKESTIVRAQNYIFEFLSVFIRVIRGAKVRPAAR
jgi:hypothetical protein